MDARTSVPPAVNEPVRGYAPGSPERASLLARLDELASGGALELTAAIGAERRLGGGAAFEVTMPSDHRHVLGRSRHSDQGDARDAVRAATAAAPGWSRTTLDERAAIFLRAAELLAGPWRDTLNAATMLGQAKTVQQAEIDAACELVDFLRFNVAFAEQIHAEQPVSSPGVWNRVDYRPLDGFVYAVTPFNFTAIAGNLPTAPALMGNTVVWKPSPTQQLAAHFTMELLTAAGLPPGVITMLPGDGLAVSEVVLAERQLAGLHFTGSVGTFQHLWRTIGENIAGYAGYPRVVGETGGKDFVVVHPSADVDVARTALVRGAFEYSGQKCSAASRAFVARSVWQRLRDDLVTETEELAVGDVRDLTQFTSAVIDRRSFTRLDEALQRAHANPAVDVLAGGTTDDSTGWYVRPTLLHSDDPGQEIFSTEYFGPVLAVHVYEDGDFERVLETVDTGTPYGLTGAVIAEDRAAVRTAQDRLRQAAGNFYVNDKPTGAVVGQQPFGGARASGTNDKAGSVWNLIRWASPRVVKETLVPPTTVAYPHMAPAHTASERAGDPEEAE